MGDLLVLGALFADHLLLPVWRSGVASSGKLWVIATAVLCLVCWRLILVSAGVYAPRPGRTAIGSFLQVTTGVSLCVLLAILVAELIRTTLHASLKPWHGAAVYWGMCLLGAGAVRALALAWMRRLRPDWRTYRNFIVIGSGAKALRITEDWLAGLHGEYRLLGYVDSEPQPGFVPETLVLGSISDFERILIGKDVDEVLIALPMQSHHEIIGEVIALCQRSLASRASTLQTLREDLTPSPRSG